MLAAAAALLLSLRSRVTPCIFRPPPAPSAPRPRSALRRPAAPPCPGSLLRPPSRLALPTERGRGPGGHAQRGAPARPPPRLTQPFLLPPTQDAARGERSLRGQAAQAGGGCVPGANALVHGVGCRQWGRGVGGVHAHARGCLCMCVRAHLRAWVGDRPRVGVTTRRAWGCLRQLGQAPRGEGWWCCGAPPPFLNPPPRGTGPGCGALCSAAPSRQVGEQSRPEPLQLPVEPHTAPYRASLEEDAASLSGESLDSHLQGEWGLQQAHPGGQVAGGTPPAPGADPRPSPCSSGGLSPADATTQRGP